MRYFFSKGVDLVTSANSGIFRFLTGLEKKAFKVAAFLDLV